MGDYFQQYNEKKNAVIEYIDDTLKLLGEMEQVEDAEPLERLKRNVENNQFSIVLVGEFSAGKSTFLNALMGKRILPSFKSETTATVNFLRHSSQAPAGVCGRVYYKNGSIEDLHELSLQAIEKVVSTKGNKGDEVIAETVDHVDLFLDSNFLKDGVMLVDSPGLNGVADHHREITEQQIKASHASIFMFNAEQPGSKTNFDYLQELKKKSNNIFFVMNKIDVINPDEDSVEDVCQGLRNTYHKKFPDETTLPHIYPVSSHKALKARDPNAFENETQDKAITAERRAELETESRMGEFEQRLMQYLTQGEKAHAQLCGPVENVIRTLRGQRDRINAQIELLEGQTGTGELLKQKESLESTIAELRKNRTHIDGELKSEVNEALRNVLEKAEKECADVYTSVARRLEDFELPEEIEEYAAGLGRELENRFMRVARTKEEDLRGELLDIIGTQYEQHIDELDEKLAQFGEEKAFQFSKRDLVIEKITAGVNLERFSEECKALQVRIAELEKEAEESTLNAFARRKQELDLEGMRAELKSLKDRRDHIQDSFVLPDVETSSKTEYKKEARAHGLLWLPATIFLGYKRVPHTVEVSDSSKRDCAIATRDKRLSQIQEQIDDINRRISAQSMDGISSDAEEFRVKKANEELKRKRDELVELMRTHREELVKASDKQCKKMRRDILEYVGSVQGDTTDSMRKYLRDQERQCVRSVNDLLNSSLENEVSAVQKKLDDVLAVLAAEGSERDKKLESCKASKEAINSLLERGANMSAAFDEEMTDHIEEEAL